MPVHRIKQRKGILVVFNLFCFFWGVENIVAFQSSHSLIPDSAHISRTSLSASSVTAARRQRRRFEDDKYEGTSNPFLNHLEEMLSQVRNTEYLAYYMDDDLKRMETKYYNLSDEDAPKCTREESEFSYDGPIARPDASCYEIVTQAYANAKTGTEGALLAEDVVRRFESREEDGGYAYADRYMLKGVLKAWVRVLNFEKAYGLLKLMEHRFNETKDMELAPDTRMYNVFTDGLADFGVADKAYSAKAASEILHSMRSRYISGENPIAMPNRYTYTHVMLCESRIGNGVESFERIEKLYRQLETDYRDLDFDGLKPDALSALPLFQVAVNSRGNCKVAERAFEIFDELQQRYNETGDPAYRPLEKMYKYLFTSVARLDASQAKTLSNRVDQLIESMKNDYLVPSVYTMTTAINAKATQRSEESMKEAEGMMRSLEVPDVVAYQTLIKGYARMGRIDRSLHLLDELESLRLQDKVEVMTLGVILDSLGKTKRFKTEYAIEKAESILQKLVSRYQEGSVKRSEKSVGWVFDCVIRLLSKRRSPEAASRVRAIVDEMESLNEAYPGHFEPTPSTYLLAIDALAQSGEANAGKHAMGLLKKVKEPTIRVLASTLSSVARSSGRGIVKTTEKLFQQMLESYRMGDRSASVNARTLTMVLSTILKAPEPDSGERALKVLRQTIELGRENLSDLAPNTIVFNCVLNGLARRKASSDAMSVFEEMKTLQTLGYDSAPDAISYACVSRAIASDYQASTAMERLDEIVAEVRGEIENGRLKSDAQLFNTFIKSYACLSKNEEAAAEKANELLRQLELSTTGDRGISPDLLTYTYVCEACAMSRAPNALNMTEEIFRKAQVLAEQGLIAPLDCDIASYTVLAHTRSKEEDALQRAEQFIEEMEGTRPELLNTRSYNTLLAAYANSNDPDKVARVCAIFGRLSAMNTGGQKNCEPDTGSFNWLILAAANSFSEEPCRNRESFEVALENFKALHAGTDIRPDILTYEFFLRTCNRLLPSGNTRSKLVEKAFALCSKRGLVTSAICREAAKSDFRMMLNKLETRASKVEGMAFIPYAWCEKVPYRKRSQTVSLIGSSYID